ncbi:hypothetical protein XA67_04890 [Comamonas thiooxydans]|uniref:hypothetical protein n=1 Tax=Comamonas thiooxydans TaxID=363952 RepID=UPI0006212097|nr:hypothetical protein [Comamonas thiooxydans]KKI15154.1 hypothetical protein XA67_04890 [Comamonas thiooxydans]
MTEKKSVIVYGPQGSGKTRHAEALRQHFLLDTVFDGEEVHGVQELPASGALILMTHAPERTRRALHIDEALRRMQHEPAGYPFA